MLLAAMLAMLLVSAVPAFAQEVTFGDDGDDSTNQFVESDQFSVADFGDQNASIEQNVTGDDNQTGAAIGQDQIQFSDQVIQNSLADDNSFAFNDSDFDGIDDDFDNSLVFGDFDNDGINDQFELGNGFDNGGDSSAAASASSAAASGGSAYASAFASAE